MKHHFTPALALLLAICMTHTGMGQQPKKRDYRGVCGLLFYDKGIAEELKLTPELMEQAKQVANEVTDRFQDRLAKAKPTSPFAPPDEKWISAVKEAAKETDHALARVLTPAQMKRLQQIHMQAYFYSTILDPKTVQVLKLTPEQRKKLDDLSGQGHPSMTLEQQKKWDDQGLAVLRPEQLKAWEELVGPRYTFRK